MLKFHRRAPQKAMYGYAKTVGLEESITISLFIRQFTVLLCS